MCKNFIKGRLIFKDNHVEDILGHDKLTDGTIILYTKTDLYMYIYDNLYKRVSTDEKDFSSVKYDYELVEIDRFEIF